MAIQPRHRPSRTTFCRRIVGVPIMVLAVALATISGCRSTSPAAPHTNSNSVTASNANAAEPSTHQRHPWVDPDDVDAPNVIRIGSVKWVTTDAVTAVSNRGRVLSGEWGLGVVEWRKDGRRRTLLVEPDDKPIFLDRAWYDANDNPVFFSDKRIHRFEHNKLTSTASPCLFSSSPPVVSADRKVFACVTQKGWKDNHHTLTVNAYSTSTTGGEPFSLANTFTSKARALLAISNAGVVLVRREDSLVAFAGKVEKWSAACPKCSSDVLAGIDETSGSVVVKMRSGQQLTTHDLASGKTSGEKSMAKWGDFSFSSGLVVDDGVALFAVEADRTSSVVRLSLPFDDNDPVGGVIALDARPIRLESSPDGKALVALGTDQALSVFDLKRGARMFGGTTRGMIEDVWITIGGRHLVVVREEGRLERIDIERLSVTASIPFDACTNDGCAAAQHPTTRTFAVTTATSGIALFDPVTLERMCSTASTTTDFILSNHGPDGAFTSLRLDEEEGGTWMTSIASDCSVRAEKRVDKIVWPAAKTTSTRVFVANGVNAPSAQPMLLDATLGLTPNGDAVSSALATWSEAKHPRGNNSASPAAAFGYRSVAFIEGDGGLGPGAHNVNSIVRIEDTATGAEVTTWSLDRGVVASRVATSPQNDVIAVADRGTLLIRTAR